ncbi:FAD/NAD(P)-binding domain superfamily protein [Abortiporus biennis]
MAQDTACRIAICGGGISGLTLAISLSNSQSNYHIDIYEAASNFTFVGAGIGLWPRVWDSLKVFGISDEDITASHEDTRFHYYKSDQPQNILFGTSSVPLKTLHRAEFIQLLVNQLPANCRTHFSKRLVTYEGNSSMEPIILRFQDDTTAECDFLIGADGIKSTVRTCMYQQIAHQMEIEGATSDKIREMLDSASSSWTRQVAYRNLIPRERLETFSSQHPSLYAPCIFTGRHRYIVTYPVSQGQLINVVAYASLPDGDDATIPSWVTQVTKDEILGHYVGWSTEMVALLNMMDESTRWAVHSVPSLSTYTFGRVALIGDAAHAMTPHQGSGAGQGIEDALVLAALLSHPCATQETIPTAFQVYDEIRRPFSQNILQLSMSTGKLYFMERDDTEHIYRTRTGNGDAVQIPPEEDLDIRMQ